MPDVAPAAAVQLPPALAAAREAIITCERCPRLRTYCQRIGREKRAAYRDDTYWARPVPGFGDPNARIVLVGLAPAAHGANRTGRIFTGDGNGGSGDFLMAALYANGLSNLLHSRSIDDGLTLHDTWVVSAVRCAPPDNKPTPQEIHTCHAHLHAELDALPNARIMIHQPSGGSQGTAADVEIQAKEVVYLRERLNAVMAERTGQSVERIEKDTDRDNFMSAEGAQHYGLIDAVLTTRTALPLEAKRNDM